MRSSYGSVSCVQLRAQREPYRVGEVLCVESRKWLLLRRDILRVDVSRQERMCELNFGRLVIVFLDIDHGYVQRCRERVAG